jgi:hypothetical protein
MAIMKGYKGMLPLEAKVPGRLDFSRDYLACDLMKPRHALFGLRDLETKMA